MPKNSFIIYNDLYEPIAGLSREEKGELLEAFFLYQREQKELENMTPFVKMAFAFFKNQFDIDSKKYEAKCKKNAENANIRWHANASDGIRPNAMDADNDNVNETDNVTDNGNYVFYIDHYLRNEELVKQIKKHYNLTNEKFLSLFSEFKLNYIGRAMDKEQFEDACTHFNNWLKKQSKEQPLDETPEEKLRRKQESTIKFG